MHNDIHSTYRVIPFLEEWIGHGGMPFGLETWALQNMQPGDHAYGVRLEPNGLAGKTPPVTQAPFVQKFQVERSLDGEVDIQFDFSEVEFFSLRGACAATIRRGVQKLTTAKWWLYVDGDGRRVWRLQWELRIVHEHPPRNVVPAAKGLCYELICVRFGALAIKYGVVDQYNSRTWTKAVFGNFSKYRNRVKDTTPTTESDTELVKALYRLDDDLHADRYTLTSDETKVMFEAFLEKCKRQNPL